MPEAEALAYLLGEMGVALAVNLTDDRLFASVDPTANSGALDVLKIVTLRFGNEPDFREDLIGAVGTLGFYLADSPSYNSDVKTLPADKVVAELARVGLLVRHHYERGDGRVPMISFMPVPDHPIRSNAHLLMKLTVDRFTNEPDFAADLTRVVIATGQSQHDA